MSNSFIQADDIKHNWSESTSSFDCPCGEKNLVIDGESEPIECRCGRVYRVRHYVEVDRQNEDALS